MPDPAMASPATVTSRLRAESAFGRSPSDVRGRAMTVPGTVMARAALGYRDGPVSAKRRLTKLDPARP